ncbi:MAG: putative toxin-antitoxin system toxin component, PIN family [Betaproteobacteria bacterium RIFCSPHIGHO2_12_FULL_69_13]|nr:MAG: putative toxin-antitoxin system toxin component, PIN family [Betaproteobacteria bacterium RIFCSPHIGHO2_12_FULL_69_13]OGA64474.1 MAG: putative toxin-antitoxin system toxin component, PIN family [Betaproteobacteria bacterium RIFCSPLOWO2_12_FULL_68_20]
MRLVLDTNAAISALLWSGTPGRLIEAAQQRTVSLVSSAPLLAELRGVLSRDKFAGQLQAKGLTAEEIADGYAALVTIVVPAVIAPKIAKDAADDMVVATALAAGADLIVSGDAHVLDLKNYQGMPIVSAAEAVKRVEQRR